MTNGDTGQRSAFVLMPFEERLEWAYERLVKPAFEDAGYRVSRADDIGNQQNILKDIVTAILESDVIIADVTDANPNVYYELGLSHALEKQVVLLSQNVSKAPFDLRSYRIIEYGDRFDRFEDAKKQLGILANGTARGSVRFGNPVSDFRPESSPALSKELVPSGQKDTLVQDDSNEEPLGAVDLAIKIDDGIEEGKEILEEVNKLIVSLGDHAKEMTPRIQKAGEERNMRGLRTLFRTSSSFFDERNANLRDLNRRLRVSWIDTSNALEIQFTHPANTQEAREKALVTIHEMCAKAGGARAAIANLAATVGDLPDVEQMFNRAKRKIAKELEDFSAISADIESLGGRLDAISKHGLDS